MRRLTPAVKFVPVLLLPVLALMAGCGNDTPEEPMADDAAAVAAVKAANAAPPPMASIALQPINYREIEAHDLYGTSCAFAPEGGGIAALFLAMPDAGYLKLDGKLVQLAADAGSPELPYLAHERYDGEAFSARLSVAGAARGDGPETERYTGRLTIEDANGRAVYDAPGTVQCGA
jgi:hypothetical protein